MSKFRMDVDARDHLTLWCEREFRPHTAIAVRDAMEAYINSLEVDEALYAMDKGWWYVFDHTAVASVITNKN